jgi:beta-phosphoglucomutase-like phosphatase (HAD superfamily)
MRLPSAILSDADGTLVDTVKLIRHGQFEAVKTYLTQRERFLVRICPTYDVFKKLLHEHIGGSAHDTLRRTVTAFYQASPQYVERVDFDELHDTLNPHSR